MEEYSIAASRSAAFNTSEYGRATEWVFRQDDVYSIINIDPSSGHIVLYMRCLLPAADRSTERVGLAECRSLPKTSNAETFDFHHVPKHPIRYFVEVSDDVQRCKLRLLSTAKPDGDDYRTFPRHPGQTILVNTTRPAVRTLS